MKKKLLLVLFIGLLFGDHSLVCMKRKRSDDARRHVKRRKVVKRKKRWGKYDQYKQADGKYYCPDCDDYSANNLDAFRAHLRRKGHGRYKTKKVKKRGSIYDKYKGDDGKYHCPNCDNYSTESYRVFEMHLSRKRHDHFRTESTSSEEEDDSSDDDSSDDEKSFGDEKKTRKLFVKKIKPTFIILPSESISLEVEERGLKYSLMVLPVLSQGSSRSESIFYALFNAVCTNSENKLLIHDFKQLDVFLKRCKVCVCRNDIALEDIDADTIQKLSKDVAFFEPLREDEVGIIEDKDNVLPQVRERIEQFKEDGIAYTVIVNRGDESWITIRFLHEDGWDKIEVMDSQYEDYSSFGKLGLLADDLYMGK